MEPQLRTPNYPDQILEDAAAVKIRQYRNPYRHHRMPTPRSAKLERACAKHFFQPLCGPAVAMQHTQLCAQISELEPIITVRGPHSQHMFSAANAPLCNIRERKQQSFEQLSSPASALWHPQLRKMCSKREFPRPGADLAGPDGRHAEPAGDRARTSGSRRRSRPKQPYSDQPRFRRTLNRRTATANSGFPGAQLQRSCTFAFGNPGLVPLIQTHAVCFDR
jgi:hypothetical protein